MRQARTSRALRALVAAAALLTAGGAFADGFTAEIGPSWLFGRHVIDAHNPFATELALGYRFTPNLGIRASTVQDFDIAGGLDTSGRSRFAFSHAVQATYTTAIAPKLFVDGGLGIAKTHLDAPGGPVHVTEGVVSTGLQYRFATHFATELRYEWLTHTGTSALHLMLQVPF